MNATLPPVPAESPSPLLRELLAAEPELARFIAAKDIEASVRQLLRNLRVSAELDRRADA